ncbi:MAG: nuclear transport factor 2 family protein [Bacteroidota bacterium]
MIKTQLALLLACLFSLACSQAQTESIRFELNRRNPAELSQNPFAKFVGEWTLEGDQWTQNWGGETETIRIPGHHTVSTAINTDNSLLSIIDGPEPNGHIFWSYNPNTGEVSHLSSFGRIRAGKGGGTVSEQGDLRLKLEFEGEPAGTYRIYTYQWMGENAYHMKSVQYAADGEATGLFYEGTFVRIRDAEQSIIRQEILTHGQMIRDAFAKGDLEQIRSLHHPEVEKALGYTDVKRGREEVIAGIAGTLNHYSLEFVENEVESIYVQGDLAIEQTKFSIRGTPKGEGESFLFSGRTMVTYIRHEASPSGWATIREIIQPAVE